MMINEDRNRPNPIALTVVELLHREGVWLNVRGVDMLDDTPNYHTNCVDRPEYLLSALPLAMHFISGSFTL